MATRLVIEGTHDRCFMHPFGETRQMLANFYAGNVGRNRLEFAANFFGSIRLEIDHILSGRSTQKEQQNHIFGFSRLNKTEFFGFEQLRKPETAQSRKRTRFEGFTTGEAVTTAAFASQHGDHVVALR